MSGGTVAGREFGEGPLSRAVAAVYTLLVVEALQLLTVAPGLVLLTVLSRDASNLPLVALAAAPVGPAVAAGLIALRRLGDLADLHPARAFWHGYRVNAVPVLRLWIPMLALLTVIGINLTHLDVAGVPAGWAVPLVLIAAGTVLWGMHALVIAALFAFRTRDVARLAWYFVARTPLVTLGAASLVIVMAAVVVFASEAALALLGSLFTLMLLQTYRPLLARVEEDFTG